MWLTFDSRQMHPINIDFFSFNTLIFGRCLSLIRTDIRDNEALRCECKLMGELVMVGDSIRRKALLRLRLLEHDVDGRVFISEAALGNGASTTCHFPENVMFRSAMNRSK